MKTQKKTWVLNDKRVSEGTPGAKPLSLSALYKRTNKVWVLNNKIIPNQQPNAEYITRHAYNKRQEILYVLDNKIVSKISKYNQNDKTSFSMQSKNMGFRKKIAKKGTKEELITKNAFKYETIPG